MSCTTEINVCPQTVSDQCVRYTGPNIPSLGISTGDQLSVVEAQIIDYLVPLLTGVGDAITIDSSDTCAVINQFLTAGSTHNSYELIRALNKAVCSIKTEVDDIVAQLVPPTYDVDCLTGVTSTSSTAEVLQAAILKLCSTATDLTALELNVANNYVSLSQINGLIAAYLASITPSVTQQNAKMVPFVAYEYHGSTANFDANGVGIPANGFDKVYICNGFNGTPDKRGVVAVGAIQGIAGAALDPLVNPVNPGNPNYAIGVLAGTNTTVLTIDQIPNHTHTPTTTVTESSHYHALASAGTYGAGGPTLNAGGTLQVEMAEGGNGSYRLSNSTTPLATLGKTSSVKTNVAVSVTNALVGGGNSHSNIQPVLPCLYIMYIP